MTRIALDEVRALRGVTRAYAQSQAKGKEHTASESYTPPEAIF